MIGIVKNNERVTGGCPLLCTLSICATKAKCDLCVIKKRLFIASSGDADIICSTIPPVMNYNAHSWWFVAGDHCRISRNKKLSNQQQFC